MEIEIYKRSNYVESWLLKNTNINPDSKQGQNLRGLYGNVVLGNSLLTENQNKQMLERLLTLAEQALKNLAKQNDENKAFVELVFKRWEIFESPKGVELLFLGLESYGLF